MQRYRKNKGCHKNKVTKILSKDQHLFHLKEQQQTERAKIMLNQCSEEQTFNALNFGSFDQFQDLDQYSPSKTQNRSSFSQTFKEKGNPEFQHSLKSIRKIIGRQREKIIQQSHKIDRKSMSKTAKVTKKSDNSKMYPSVISMDGKAFLSTQKTSSSYKRELTLIKMQGTNPNMMVQSQKIKNPNISTKQTRPNSGNIMVDSRLLGKQKNMTSGNVVKKGEKIPQYLRVIANKIRFREPESSRNKVAFHIQSFS